MMCKKSRYITADAAAQGEEQVVAHLGAGARNSIKTESGPAGFQTNKAH